LVFLAKFCLQEARPETENHGEHIIVKLKCFFEVVQKAHGFPTAVCFFDQFSALELREAEDKSAYSESINCF
jgi:hypothetical protein